MEIMLFLAFVELLFISSCTHTEATKLNLLSQLGQHFSTSPISILFFSPERAKSDLWGTQQKQMFEIKGKRDRLTVRGPMSPSFITARSGGKIDPFRSKGTRAIHNFLQLHAIPHTW